MTQLQIAQAELVQDLQFADDRALIREEGNAFLDRELEDFGNVPPAPGHFECLLSVAAAFACRTDHLHVRHERQLRDDRAVSGAFLATAALDIEAEVEPGRNPRSLASSVSAKSSRIES